ncbi:MAG: VOC family protein [Candidatus Latescibacteria bacterium]|nr:VOC family protein [Candidatus Latescibacterota bacterium]NIM21166.1 VOC family protein [Candidatus Latescibacterota bacterium]NIM65301.1 VOC family protein [Candidatus Latescibacterota bacterium]NIO01816.1 VOC family protein [Candidatus Latescibacterota bacterium]NIO28333.1 VOC family protein [Candidatus Latescibacterota bacterium]
MPRPVHFEIPADNVDRAANFYRQVFDWELQKWEGPMEYWLVNTGPSDQPGINGGLMPRQNPGQLVVNTIDVPDIDEFQAKIEKNGGEIVVPKMAVPGVGWTLYFKDTEGNIFSLMQEDLSAK